MNLSTRVHNMVCWASDARSSLVQRIPKSQSHLIFLPLSRPFLITLKKAGFFSVDEKVTQAFRVEKRLKRIWRQIPSAEGFVCASLWIRFKISCMCFSLVWTLQFSLSAFVFYFFVKTVRKMLQRVKCSDFVIQKIFGEWIFLFTFSATSFVRFLSGLCFCPIQSFMGDGATITRIAYFFLYFLGKWWKLRE